MNQVEQQGPVSETVLACTHLLVLAGGRGERVAEITRRFHGRTVPKQFCAFGGERTLLQATVERFTGLVPSRRTSVVVTGGDGRRAAEQLDDHDGVRILAQPLDRGTAAGLLLAVLEVMGRDPDALCIVTPADHTYDDSERFRDTVAHVHARLRGRRYRDAIVLVGAQPAAPRCDFGWIVPGEEDARTGLERVRHFEEKPSAARARELMEAGGVWNTLVLVGAARAFVHLYQRHAPALLEALLPVICLDDRARSAFLERVYPALAPIDVSRNLLSVADDLVVTRLPVEAGWDDLGDEARLLGWMKRRTPLPPTQHAS